MDFEDISKAVFGLAGGVGAMLFWFHKAKPGFAKDDLAVKQAEADIGIIDRLDIECRRLSDQNTKLAESLNDFQMQLLDFHTENRKLASENELLRKENSLLRDEIVLLRNEVRELASRCMACTNTACIRFEEHHENRS